MNPENDPSLILGLASSIAQRQIAENAWKMAILGNIIPLSPPIPLEVERSIQTGATVAMLKTLEDPSATADPVEIARTIIDEQALADMLISINEEPTQENTALLRALVETQIKTIFSSNDDNRQLSFMQQMQAAESIAAQHTVSVAEVFADDQLYAELMITADTPESLVKKTVNTFERFREGALGSVADSILSLQVESGELSQEDYLEERQELLLELSENTEFLENFNNDLSLSWRGTLELLSKSIERFWGDEELLKLAGTLGQLATKFGGRSTLSEGHLKRQQYNDTVAILCSKQGWDPSSLTVEQTQYINARPEIQDIWDKK